MTEKDIILLPEGMGFLYEKCDINPAPFGRFVTAGRPNTRTATAWPGRSRWPGPRWRRSAAGPPRTPPPSARGPPRRCAAPPGPASHAHGSRERAGGEHRPGKVRRKKMRKHSTRGYAEIFKPCVLEHVCPPPELTSLRGHGSIRDPGGGDLESLFQAKKTSSVVFHHSFIHFHRFPPVFVSSNSAGPQRRPTLPDTP